MTRRLVVSLPGHLDADHDTVARLGLAAGDEFAAGLEITPSPDGHATLRCAGDWALDPADVLEMLRPWLDQAFGDLVWEVG